MAQNYSSHCYTFLRSLLKLKFDYVSFMIPSIFLLNEGASSKTNVTIMYIVHIIWWLQYNSDNVGRIGQCIGGYSTTTMTVHC